MSATIAEHCSPLPVVTIRADPSARNMSTDVSGCVSKNDDWTLFCVENITVSPAARVTATASASLQGGPPFLTKSSTLAASGVVDVFVHEKSVPRPAELTTPEA